MPTFEEAKQAYPTLTRQEFDAGLAAYEALPVQVEYHEDGSETVHDDSPEAWQERMS